MFWKSTKIDFKFLLSSSPPYQLSALQPSAGHLPGEPQFPHLKNGETVTAITHMHAYVDCK